MSSSVLFLRLLSRLSPTQTEVNRLRLHGTVIKSRLAGTFQLKKFMTVGSHARDTAIKEYSDIDYFAVVARSDVRRGGQLISSTTFLDNVRKDISARFYRTDVSKDAQAIVVQFSNGALPVDIVPAVFERFEGKNPIYLIPDGFGDWFATSPEAHNSYLAEADQRTGGKLRRVAQMFKYWRECRNPRIPLSSFHIEMLAGVEGLSTGVLTYGQCLFQLFDRLTERQCRAIRDPLGISGLISATKTDPQREQALKSVSASRDHARRALWAEKQNNMREAVRQWNIVFNGELV